MTQPKLAALIAEFNQNYDAKAKDRVWERQSQNFKEFWERRVLGKNTGEIPNDECDEVIRILDRNGKGNTKDSEAVAKAMVPQGAWRRMLNEFHANRELGNLVTLILREEEPEKKAGLIDNLYKLNAKAANNLTGPSGNTVNAFLAAYDPMNNLSVISLKHRRALIEFLGLQVPVGSEKDSIGKAIVMTNSVLRDGLGALGVEGSARTKSRFCYYPGMTALWKGEHTVKVADKSINVTIPLPEDKDGDEKTSKEDLRQSMQIQGLIAKIGETLGFKIWLPRGDRSRVLTVWKPDGGVLLEDLPLGYEPLVIKTIEQIDVLWLRRRSIVRAFEVEHTTSVYSGLLRMADLVALLPDINIKLHIVAPAAKRDKVMQEIQRPVFSMLEGRVLSEMCTYLSYDSIEAIGKEKLLVHMSDSALEAFEERAD
jgi:hypothetical protein